MKVRTKAPTSWALKSHRPKVGEQLRYVTDITHPTGPPRGKAGLTVYKVDQTKFPKELRKLKPWEYLKASGEEKLPAATQAALQSVFHTASVKRAQRIHATTSMKLGRVVWRKILWTMKNEVNSIRSIHKWYNVPFYYLKFRYLRWCIDEIEACKDMIFNKFGFSYADLRKDPDILKPKAKFLRAFATKELLFSSDLDSLNQESADALRAFAETYEPPQEVRVTRQRQRRRR